MEQMTVDELSKKMEKQLEKLDENQRLQVFMRKDSYKIKSNAGFALIFSHNFYEALTKLKLTPTEVKVIFYLLKVLEYGNLLSVNQSKIATELGTTRSVISRAFTNLKKLGVLFTDQSNNLYLNLVLVTRGNIHHLSGDYLEQYKTSVNMLSDRGLDLILPFDPNATGKEKETKH